VQNEQDLYYTSKAHGLTPFAAGIISSLSAKKHVAHCWIFVMLYGE
jgi:hypothetical protein